MNFKKSRPKEFVFTKWRGTFICKHLTGTQSEMSQHTIFVAEDDEDDQFLLQTAFASTGTNCDLVFFTNGEELISQLAAVDERPTLVLLDLNMPIMDGFQTLIHLRNQEAYKTMPVLVLTTSSQREDVTRAYSLGANSFITKPHQYADLTRTVHQLQEFWLATASIPQSDKARQANA